MADIDGPALHSDTPDGWVRFDNWRPFVAFLAACAKTDRTEAELNAIATAVEVSRPVEGGWFRDAVADNYRIEFSLGNGGDGRLRYRIERCLGPDELWGMIAAGAWVMARYALRGPERAAPDGGA